MANPLAHMRKALSAEFCNTVSDRNPMIAPPLRMGDCSLISDGVAALVLVAEDMAAGFDHAIGFCAAVQANDFLPLSRRSVLDFAGSAEAFARAYSASGVTHRDLSFAEVHDRFTIAELMTDEALGLAPKGQGARVVDEGTVPRGGALPVNLSGGLKAKGHPVGATGVPMHVLAARQLAGDVGEMQVPAAGLGCVFNMGGRGLPPMSRSWNGSQDGNEPCGMAGPSRRAPSRPPGPDGRGGDGGRRSRLCTFGRRRRPGGLSALHGISAGDRVALLAKNSTGYIVAL